MPAGLLLVRAETFRARERSSRRDTALGWDRSWAPLTLEAALVRWITPRPGRRQLSGCNFAASTALPRLTAKLWPCPRWSIVEPLLQGMQFSAVSVDLVTHLQEDRRLPPRRGAR